MFTNKIKMLFVFRGMSNASTDLYEKATEISSLIKIYGSPEDQTWHSQEMDEIDANEFETFTLEEIKALILNYRKKEKDFLLARVTTPDPENGSLFYNFYYSAPEINRVLFRFESNRRLLHRMKVKNPLNNMFIVGQVFYYKIDKQQIDKAIVDFFYLSSNDLNKERKTISEVFRPPVNNHVSSKSQPENMNVQSAIFTIKESPSEIINAIREGKAPMPETPENRKIIYKANYFANDDDFLIKSEIRDYFKSNALDPNDEFLYEIDRTQNDFLALLEDVSDSHDAEINDWRRIFSAHISLALSMLIICLLIGGGPVIAIVLLPIALLIMGSFLLSLLYVLFCRRSTFDTLAVESVSSDVI
ncbi:hypothetical protein NUSPORA_01557 [Nucleospora cyclopteri]